MYDWITELRPGQRVLDVGSGAGSFPNSLFGCCVVALDEDLAAFRTAAELPPGPYFRVFGRSGGMPFGNSTFDLVICHHALEHIEGVEATLGEIARVLKPSGRLYIAVPNGYGFCDGLYRWIFQGGGHVNRFRRDALVASVEGSVRIRLVRRQQLYSSFVYLRRLIELLQAPPPDLAPRLLAFRRLPPRAIGLLQHVLYIGTRLADRLFHTDLALYGWAFYFERSSAPVVQEPGYINVCLYCGAGHPAASLERPSRFTCRCTACNRVNPYFAPFGNTL